MYCGFNFEDAFGFNTFLNFHPGQLALMSTFLSPKHNHSTKKQTRNYQNTICCEVLKLYCYFEVHDRVDDIWALSYYDCIPYTISLTVYTVGPCVLIH